MSLNVNFQNFKTGIDTSILKEVSQEILKRAAEKNSQYSVHSSAKPADLGVNLYNGAVDNNTARQIAMNNSGLQVQLNQNVLQSIHYLNTQAAQKVQQNVEGKITVALNEGTGTHKNTEPPKFNSIISLAAGKDKNGSPMKYRGELLQAKKDEEKQNGEELNIFG